MSRASRIAVAAAALFALAAARDTTQYVSLVSAGPVRVAAGASAPVELRFQVAGGFHINGAQPNSDLLIPTRLTLTPAPPLEVGGLDYPPASKLTLSFDPRQPLLVYSGEFSIHAKVTAGRRAAPGSYSIPGVLDYQACSDRACYPPRKLPVTLQVVVQ